jgi:hypothetical protein
MSNIDATKSPVHHWESEDFLVNPPGIPYSSHRDLDLFIDAAESAENRWRDKLAELQKRIADAGLSGADEVGPELFRRSMKAIEQLNHLWHCLWLHRCLKTPVGPNNPTQLARWCRFRRRLLPHSPGVDSFDWRTGQRDFQETAAAILRAWQTPALWTNFPDLFDAPKKSPTKKPAANKGEPAEARLVRITWEYLRGVARGLPIPSEPTNVTTQAETRAALDLVENWCASPVDDKPRERLIFDVKGCSITLDGVAYNGLEHEFVVIIQAIFQASPRRIKSPSLLAVTGLPAETRVDRVLKSKKIPEELRGLIDSANSGYRIVLPIRSPSVP